MNLRLFSIALLISAIPTLSFADSTIILTKEDFKAAQKISRHGDVLIRIKLSKSGKAKMKKLDDDSIPKKFHVEISGTASDFKIKERIRGDGLEMGPYAMDDAQKVVSPINNQK